MKTNLLWMHSVAVNFIWKHCDGDECRHLVCVKGCSFEMDGKWRFATWIRTPAFSKEIHGWLIKYQKYIQSVWLQKKICKDRFNFSVFMWSGLQFGNWIGTSKAAVWEYVEDPWCITDRTRTRRIRRNAALDWCMWFQQNCTGGKNNLCLNKRKYQVYLSIFNPKSGRLLVERQWITKSWIGEEEPGLLCWAQLRLSGLSKLEIRHL